MGEFFAGIDIGSTMTKAVIFEEDLVASVIGPTGPEQRKLANRVMEEVLNRAGLEFHRIAYVVSTGYGRLNVPFADRQITEISCHAKGIARLFPTARTVIDIGGQDSKGISIDPDTGRPTDFIMNDKCAAGSGRFIEVIADTLGLKLEDMGPVSLESKNPAHISNICTIWAQQEVASCLAEGVAVPDLVAGVHVSLAERVARMVQRLRLEDDIILTGGGAKNIGLVRALSGALGRKITVPEEPLITGALGAAILGKEIVEKAEAEGAPVETKERVLKEVKIL